MPSQDYFCWLPIPAAIAEGMASKPQEGSSRSALLSSDDAVMLVLVRREVYVRWRLGRHDGAMAMTLVQLHSRGH